MTAVHSRPSRPTPTPRQRLFSHTLAALTLTLCAGLAGLVGLTPSWQSTPAATAVITASTATAGQAGVPILPSHARLPGINSVLVISIDGLTPRALTTLKAAGAPQLFKLKAEGASTFEARTEYEMTVTLPNHTGMVTGRRIDAASGGHGVIWNDDRTVPATVQEAAGGPIDSVFSVVHGAGQSTALFASKTKFSLWQRSWPDALDQVTINLNTTALTKALIADLTAQPRGLRFLHLADPDSAGHAAGWMSSTYLNAVRRTDKLVGSVLRTIRRDPILSGGTLVIVTADHGGVGKDHSNTASSLNYRIPFFVRGPGVPAGADLYALNTGSGSWANPGTGRPTYDAAAQPIRNGDVANLVTDALGLPPVPGSEFDVAQNLEITTPAG